MKKFILVFLCLSSCFHSPKSREVANTKAIHPLMSIPTIAKPATTEVPLTPAQSCSKELCGPSPRALSFFTQVESARKANYKPGNPDFDKVQEALVKYLEGEDARLQYKDNSVAYLLDHPEMKAPEEIQAFYNSYHYLLMYLQGGSEGRWDASGASLQDQVWAQKVSQSQHGRVVAAKYYRLYAIEAWKNSLKLREGGTFASLEGILSIYMPTVGTEEAIPAMLAECRGKIKRWNKYFKQMMFNNMFPICSSVKNQSELHSETGFAMELQNLAWMDAIIPERATPLLLEREWDWHSDLKTYAENTADLEREYFAMSPRSLNYRKNNLIQTCQRNLKLPYGVAPTTDELKKVNELFRDIKASANKLVQFKDQWVQSQWRNILNSAKITFPIEGKKLIDSFLSDIQSRTYKDTPWSPNNPHKHFLVFFNIIQANTQKPGIYNYLERRDEALQNYCKFHTFPAFSDFADVYVNRLRISWPAVRYPDWGAGIIAHELGHSVSVFLKSVGQSQNGPYYFLNEDIKPWTHRTCVNVFYKADATGEQLSTEEDWADYWSSLIVKDLLPQRPSLKNFACFLMSQSPSWNFLGSPTHAAPAFRAIHIDTVLNGQVRPSCSQFLSQVEPKKPDCYFSPGATSP